MFGFFYAALGETGLGKQIKEGLDHNETNGYAQQAYPTHQHPLFHSSICILQTKLPADPALP